MSAKPDKKPQEAAVAPKKPGGMGLGGMKLSGLLKPQAATVADSALKELPLDVIDEDADQPRLEDNPGFRPEMIAEIGGTIKARGVKQPISVRESPDAPGRYIINDGARRFRGSKWADKTTIWAIIDNDFVPDDQVVANIQREGHTAREIAKLIGQRMASGMKKGEIAKRWGKSNAYITQHAALLDLPAPIAQAFDSGRIADVTLVNELVTAHKSNPQEVADWLADESQEITRGSVKLLREFLQDGKERDPNTVDAFNDKTDAELDSEGEGEGDVPPKKKTEPKEEDPTKIKKAIVQVEINGDLCRLILTKRPSDGDVAWFKNEVSGEEFEASLASAKLVALVEG
ncbi:ParB/RepB/Spo0J family partition protein [Pseudomonas sp. CFBP 13602]|uniref:ParB/RepB/Spo0J family partition protein n=1 Tax=Pseudomonas sp. CFBP 13602 TaxID=2774039 RepID=UPI001782E8F2|nr:ParB/RepB/Spo0J family partition protein [Pseudomonas sp. CFBP 13602]MBD8828995.1 ParB/RepB/Spo0J family partition protein [Pseudomonas sp. CFBP 13602]